MGNYSVGMKLINQGQATIQKGKQKLKASNNEKIQDQKGETNVI